MPQTVNRWRGRQYFSGKVEFKEQPLWPAGSNITTAHTWTAQQIFQSGNLALENNAWLVGRNNANSADVNMWKVNGDDQIVPGTLVRFTGTDLAIDEGNSLLLGTLTTEDGAVSGGAGPQASPITVWKANQAGYLSIQDLGTEVGTTSANMSAHIVRNTGDLHILRNVIFPGSVEWELENNGVGIFVDWGDDGFTVSLVNGAAGDPITSASNRLFRIQSGNHVGTTEGDATFARRLGVNMGDVASNNPSAALDVDQGAADHNTAILYLRSSDVSHGLTTAVAPDVEDDVYAAISKVTEANGGLRIVGLGEDDAALGTTLLLDAIGGTADTTKTTGGVGLLNLRAFEHDGANAIADITADGNVFAVQARVGGANFTRLLVDEDGDLYSVTAAQTFDDYDDLAMLEAYDAARSGTLREAIRTTHGRWASVHEAELIEAGVLGAPVAEGGLTNVTQLQRLHNGALRQLGRRMAALEAENAALREQIRLALN